MFQYYSVLSVLNVIHQQHSRDKHFNKMLEIYLERCPSFPSPADAKIITLPGDTCANENYVFCCHSSCDISAIHRIDTIRGLPLYHLSIYAHIGLVRINWPWDSKRINDPITGHLNVYCNIWQRYHVYRCWHCSTVK